MTNLERNVIDKGKQVCDSRQSSDDTPIGVHSSNETPMGSHNTENEGVSIDASEARISGAKRSRAKNSTIWNDFDKVIVNDKIALTTDMWTSNQQLGYMALTTHFIDKEWNMQTRIINFTKVEPPHIGLVLANVIAKHLPEWETKKKIISITVDNASSNDVLVKKLKENMKKRGINLYCCAHILNLIVQDGLSVIKDEIINIRDVVKYIKVSPSRLNGFAAAAKELERVRNFNDKEVSVRCTNSMEFNIFYVGSSSCI
ncbi:Zinc finger BED domain-containing protein RICESLEEPER 2 [Nymphaea thermarum]|nr:Zinc finger BED domain-containing protein RICESLEEPER 2 [Nymphaea thermarum]